MKKYLSRFSFLFPTILIVASVLVPLFAPQAALEQNVEAMMQGPSWQHWFGTDYLGRDLFFRTLLGARVSLTIGLVTCIATLVIGFIYGAIAGWSEGLVDRVLMRLNDIFLSIPSFILVAVICLSLQLVMTTMDAQLRGVICLCVAISASHWMGIARVTRGMVQEVKRKSFVEAAIALGGTRTHILVRHVLPNILSTLLVLTALQIPSSILYESFMSFIGLGVQPPLTSWGLLIKEGWKTLSSFPHLLLFPSFILFLTVWSFHQLIDDLRASPSHPK